MKFNHQIIVLETKQGTARNEKELKEVWEIRLKDLGISYYQVKSAKIIENGD